MVAKHCKAEVKEKEYYYYYYYYYYYSYSFRAEWMRFLTLPKKSKKISLLTGKFQNSLTLKFNAKFPDNVWAK